MASEALEKAGLHFDDLNRIRVLDEDSASQVGKQHACSLHCVLIKLNNNADIVLNY